MKSSRNIKFRVRSDGRETTIHDAETGEDLSHNFKGVQFSHQVGSFPELVLTTNQVLVDMTSLADKWQIHEVHEREDDGTD